MAHPSKAKGNRYERELVAEANDRRYLSAERAYASNGKALGCSEETDVQIIYGDDHTLRVQAKRRRSLPGYLKQWQGDTDVLVMREDRGESIALLSYEKLLDLLETLSGLMMERDALPGSAD